ncbi:MAG: SUMF1/EgtB/PvdO family nonheme iron enzyme [Myxococcales bacterium]|nr:SUMF1/EgtB/PvdO family nonheme iron enzyme [Myxococcales bacterium]
MRGTRSLVVLGVVAATLTGTYVLDAAPKKKTASLAPAPVKTNSKLVTAKVVGSAPKGCPAGMAPIPNASGGYCIDKYEAGVVEVLPGGKTKNHSPYTPVAGRKVKAVVKKGIVPQGYISQVEAKAACEEAGKRLCTPDEWLNACQGKNPTKYPYGDDEVAGRCNGDGTRQHPVVELFGPGPDAFADPNKMNDPRINALPKTLSKTGALAKCKNGWGVHDMVGNLHEWTGDGAGTSHFQGGYYMDTHKNGDGCLYKTTAHGPSYHDYSTGFRCCK